VSEALRGASVAAAAVALLLLLWLKLVPALLGALIGFALFDLAWGGETVRPPIAQIRRSILAVLLLAGLGLALFGAFELLLSASSGGLARLLQLLADTLDDIRASAPEWIASHLPDSAAALQEALSDWLRMHARDVQKWGGHALGVVLHLVIGTAVGMMAGASMRVAPRAALACAAQERWLRLVQAFSDIMSAQLRISLVNSALTGLYLIVVLPLLGFHVPLAFTLVAFTFVAGFLPIVGNLLSNTALVIAALTVSAWVGAASLAFLLVIHKLEYFLNAHFVGSRVSMPPYALLASMLVLEAAFGAWGVVAAPIYCAWLTRELREGGPI
jgi:predicted PurR-regulated permease PerM